MQLNSIWLFIQQILDHVADVLYFGALEKCNKCKNGRFIFDNSSYVCTGYVSAYFNCTNVVKVPQRKAVTIPYEVANAYPTIMQKHTFQVKNRAVLINADTSNADTSFKKYVSIFSSFIRYRMLRIGLFFI